MDFLMELVGEIILEGLFALATNKKVSRIIRYPLLTLLILLYLGIIGLLWYGSLKIYHDNLLLSIILLLLGLGLLIITVLALRKKMKEGTD